jgi:hypothetical protein
MPGRWDVVPPYAITKGCTRGLVCRRSWCHPGKVCTDRSNVSTKVWAPLRSDLGELDHGWCRHGRNLVGASPAKPGMPSRTQGE